MKQKLIYQGAEAKIFLEKDTIIKNRIKKSYRHPELDEKLRKSRTKREAKILEKASKIIFTPNPINLTDNTIKMPYIKGRKLSETLDSLRNKNQIAKIIGQETAKLHDNNIIHGDLTTSNIILQDKTNKIYFIDFGLSFISTRIEDKATDIHLFKQALEAKHYQFYQQLFNSFLQGYKSSENYDKVIEQLKKVEKRGRYKG